MINDVWDTLWLALEETFWLLARYAHYGMKFEAVIRFVDDLLTTILPR